MRRSLTFGGPSSWISQPTASCATTSSRYGEWGWSRSESLHVIEDAADRLLVDIKFAPPQELELVLGRA
jgi:hypothetical protein